MGNLSANFSREEFVCRCGCGTFFIDTRLIDFLEALRARVRHPLIIRSGCRCEQHNKDSGGAPLSQHLTIPFEEMKPCRAADIAVDSTGQRYNLVKAALDAGFSGVGVAKSFVHVDIGMAQPPYIIRPALWSY